MTARRTVADPQPARVEAEYDWIPELSRPSRSQRSFKGVRKASLRYWLNAVLDDLEAARKERDELEERLRRLSDG